MYLNHLTLSTGSNRRSPRSEVAEDTIKSLSGWLSGLLQAEGTPRPLPGPLGATYRAVALTSDGALLMTVYGREQLGTEPIALVSFGVAYRSRHAEKLWEMLTTPGAGTLAPGIDRPSVPYLAVHVFPSAAADPSALRWLPDFERCVAWTWISRQPPDLSPAS